MPMEIHIFVQQRRKYGDFEHEIGVSFLCEVENSADRQRNYKMAHILLEQEFNAFESNHLPNHAQNTEQGNVIAWAGGTLVRNVENGEVKYKLKTGRYEKWGVPVYEEVLQTFPKAAIGKDEYSMEGYGGQILIEGAYKKVLSCRHITP